MRILFADALPEAAVDLLRGQGDECVVNPDLGTDHLADAIEGFDVLVVRSTQVTAEVIDQSDQLGLIVRSGAGTNTIDCAAAADAGIYVCNVPGANSVAVAELTIAGNLRDMFLNITPANDIEFRTGTDAPTLRIDGMTVAGTTYFLRTRGCSRY